MNEFLLTRSNWWERFIFRPKLIVFFPKFEVLLFQLIILRLKIQNAFLKFIRHFLLFRHFVLRVFGFERFNDDDFS